MTQDIKKAIKYAENTNTLNLSGKGLFEIPKAVFDLTHLTRLSLRNNHIDNIPKAIENFQFLKELRLDGNKLATLPKEIGKLRHLKWLSLLDNQINELPEEISRLENLEILELGGNQLPMPIENLSRRPTELINYILQNQEKRRINEIKLIVLGNTDAGKSSIIRRLVERQYDEAEPSTKSISLQRWPVQAEHKRVQINIWDFGKKDIENGAHRFFLTERSFYLLVWHIDKQEKNKDEKLENWLKLIRYFGGESPVIIALSKTDISPVEIDRKGLQQKYPNIRAFINVSAKLTAGISELRETLKQSLLGLENLQAKWEPGWLNVKTRIEVMKKDTIHLRDYETICNKEGIDKAGQKDLLQWLHDLGWVVHFQNDIRLQDMIVLRPNWLADAVEKILKANLPSKDRALLNAEDLAWILSDGERYPKTAFPFIINMMKIYELAFDLEDNNDREYLVQDWLAPSAPKLGREFREGLDFQYHYSFMPGNMIPKLISRMFPAVSGNVYWKNGFIVSDRFNRGLIKNHPSKNLISIRVIGRVNTRRDFLAKVRSYFEYLHTLFARIDVQEKIPLPGLSGKVIDYQHLLRLEEKGIEEIHPEGANEPVSIASLLRGKGFSRQYYYEQLKELRREIENLNERIEHLWLAYARVQEMEKRARLETDILQAETERDGILLRIEDLETTIAEF